MMEPQIEIQNAVIESVRITIERGFILDSWLMLDYGGAGQGFGGWGLYLGKTATHHKVESVAGHFIYRCMEIAGVESWAEMKGRTIRAKTTGGWGGKIIAIGHIIKDDWFNPQKDFDALREKLGMPK